MSQKRRLIVNKANCGCGCGGDCHGDESGFQTFRVNFVARNSRRTTYQGRDTLVVPVILLKEAVVNGAFVAAEELVPHGWNGVPVTINHPTNSRGVNISANSPQTLTDWSVGRIFGAQVADKSLKGEAWIDVLRAEELAPGLIEALERGDEMDVSTGYFPIEREKQGAFNGKQYVKTHHNLIPDHLALLPNSEGACSWADGCGVRANQKGILMKAEEFLAGLASALGIKVNRKESSMDKEALIAKITANSKMKAAELEAMDEKTLAVIANGLKVQADDEDGKKPKENEDDDEGDDKKKPAANSRQPQIATLSAADQEALAVARSIAGDHKTKLIEKIAANTKMKAEDLQKQPIATLQMIADGIPEPVADFGGRGAPISTLAKDDPAADMVPQDIGNVIRTNFEKKGAA
ncbi:MAG: DUF2213 domain-containing protein [Xanthobacteraceae bacterium]|nr:DUF2213 domain-containing protein [Xanthobacteraceae bacterium]